MADDEKVPVMLKVGGKPFRCTCGANVFTLIAAYPDRYSCNGCGTDYIGEH